MAKIISQPISGKVGLTVDMPGRYGQVRRTWVVPANPSTVRQAAARARFTAAIGEFHALTTAQQDAWNAAARNQNSRSRLGTNGPLTGMQLYVKLATVIKMLGEDQETTPPGTVVLGEATPQNLVAANANDVVSLKLTCPTAVAEGTVLRASAPVQNSVRRTPSLDVLGTVPAVVAGSSDITTLYTARHGAPVAGQRVFVSVQTSSHGYLGPAKVFTAVIPAST
jgi:hypothetical protein